MKNVLKVSVISELVDSATYKLPMTLLSRSKMCSILEEVTCNATNVLKKQKISMELVKSSCKQLAGRELLWVHCLEDFSRPHPCLSQGTHNTDFLKQLPRREPPKKLSLQLLLPRFRRSNEVTGPEHTRIVH